MTERNIARQETERKLRRWNDIIFETNNDIYFEEGYNDFLPEEVEENYSKPAPNHAKKQKSENRKANDAKTNENTYISNKIPRKSKTNTNKTGKSAGKKINKNTCQYGKYCAIPDS